MTPAEVSFRSSRRAAASPTGCREMFLGGFKGQQDYNGGVDHTAAC